MHSGCKLYFWQNQHADGQDGYVYHYAATKATSIYAPLQSQIINLANGKHNTSLQHSDYVVKLDVLAYTSKFCYS